MLSTACSLASASSLVEPSDKCATWCWTGGEPPSLAELLGQDSWLWHARVCVFVVGRVTTSRFCGADCSFLLSKNVPVCALWVRGRGKRSAKCWAPHPFGAPPLRGPTPSGPHPSGPTLEGPRKGRKKGRKKKEQQKQRKKETKKNKEKIGQSRSNKEDQSRFGQSLPQPLFAPCARDSFFCWTRTNSVVICGHLGEVRRWTVRDDNGTSDR